MVVVIFRSTEGAVEEQKMLIYFRRVFLETLVVVEVRFEKEPLDLRLLFGDGGLDLIQRLGDFA